MNLKAEVVFVHPTSVIDQDVEIGFLTNIWHFCHIESGAKIGKNCTLGQNVYVGKNVTIGDNCKIQNNVFIPTGVEIQDNVFLGPSVTFTNVKFPNARINQHDNFLKTLVESGAAIGANSTILPGITIGKNSLIGAGSVVTKSVSSSNIVFGNPALPKGKFVFKIKDIVERFFIKELKMQGGTNGK